MDFNKLLKKLQSGAKKATRYFDPTSNGGFNFWDTPIARSLVNAQKGVEWAATKPRIDLTPTRQRYDNKAVDFGTAVAEDIVNTPSNLFKSGSRIGRDINTGRIRDPKTLLAGLGEAGSPLLNIATLGVGSSVAKQVGKQSVKEMLKYGAKEGAKYGGIYGGLSGFETGQNIDDNSDYALNLLKSIGTGAVVGGISGAGLSGAGVIANKAGKAYKKSPLASEAGFIDPEAGMKSIRDTIKNKKLPQPQSSKSLLKESYRNEFMTQSPKTYDDAKFEKWWSVLEKNLSEEDLVTGLEAGLVANKGSVGGIKKTNEWLKMKLDRKGVKGKWKELEDQADESLMYAEPQPEGKKVSEFSTTDDILPVSSQVDEVPQIQAQPTINEIIKPKTWQDELTELDDSFNQGIYDIKTRFESKGIDTDTAWAMLDGEIDIPKGLEKIVSDYDTLLKTYKKLSGKEMGEIQRYAPRKWQESGGLEQIGDSFFDKVSAKFGSSMQRTGKGTDYVRDPYFGAMKYKEEALNARYKPQLESQQTGRSVEAIQQEEKIVDNVYEAAKDPKKFKELKTLNDFIELGVKEGKEIIDMKQDYGIVTKVARDYWRKFKMIGVYDESGLSRYSRSGSYAKQRFNDDFVPDLNNGNINAVLGKIREFDPRFNEEDFLSFVDANNWATADAMIYNSLRRFERREAVNTMKEYFSTHRFHGYAEKDLDEIVKEVLINENRERDLAEKALAFTRSWVGRAALGLNIRTGVNNVLEARRGIAVGSKEDYSEAIKFALDPRNLKGILERYDVKVGQNVQDIIDRKYGKGNVAKFTETADKGIYSIFNASEGFKDAFILRIFENEGKRQGLEGRALTDFVMNRFEYYGHKYGQFGTVGLFTNKYAKTFLQFAQYPIKEAGIYYDMARNLKPGSKHQKDAAMYLTKLTTMNLGLIAGLGALYGARAEEIFGAIPFNIQTSDQGLKVNISPLATLAQDLTFGIREEMSKAEKDGEEFNLNDAISRKARRSIGSTLIPAGNQLINKIGVQNFLPDPIDNFFTDSTLSDMERGYNPTATGMARFLAPQSMKDKIIGLTMGPYATSEARNYFNNDQSPLGKNQTADFDAQFATDPESAINFFKGKMNEREINKEEKKMLEKFKNGEISADAFRGTDIGAKPVMNGKMTVQEMLAQAQEENEVYSKIKEIKYGKEYKDIPMDKKEQLLKEAYGYTDKQLADADLKYIKNTLDSKETALLISQDENPDFVNYYKNELLTSEVAKELERMGKIPDADALMDNMKMTDPYYQKKEMRKLLEKQIKARSSIDKKYSKKMTDLIISTNNKNAKVTANLYKRKALKPKRSKSISNMLISPNDVILKKRKLVKL
jgi:uncharacterized protein YajQ (UPF0234 family)